MVRGAPRQSSADAWSSSPRCRSRPSIFPAARSSPPSAGPVRCL